MQIRHETLMRIYRQTQDICDKKELLISDVMRLIEKAIENHERGYSLALEIPHKWTGHSLHTIFLPLDEAEFSVELDAWPVRASPLRGASSPDRTS